MILWLTPIFFLLFLGIIMSQLITEDKIMEPFHVAIVNEDPTFETKLVIKQLTDSTHLNQVMKTIETDSDDANKLLKNDQIAATIFIPKGFSKDVAKGINTPITVISNTKKPLQSRLVRHIMDSAANLTSSAQSGINTVSYFMKEGDFKKKQRKSQFKRDVSSFSLHILGRGKLFDEKEQNHLFNQNLIHYYLLSFYVLLIMIWSFLALYLFKRKMKNAVYDRFLSLGYTSFHFLIGRGLAAFILVVISTLLAFVPVFLWQELIQGSGFFVLLMSTFLIAGVFISFFILLDFLLQNDKIYFVLSLILILLGALFGEHFIPIMYFPEWMQLLNHLTINGWVLTFVFSTLQEPLSNFDWKNSAVLFSFFVLNLIVVKTLTVKWKGRIV